MATAALLAMSACDASDASAASSSYRWSKRPLFIFAGGVSDKALADQRRIVSGSRNGFSDRDMVVVYVVGDSVSAELGGKPGQSAQRCGRATASANPSSRRCWSARTAAPSPRRVSR